MTNPSVADAPVGSPCGPGTHLSNGVCTPDDHDAPPPPCGPGTHAEGEMCADALDAPAPPTCGPGTHDAGGICAPDNQGFLLRILSTTVPADPFARIPVVAIGTRADGTPALDQVVFNASLPGTGTFAPPTATLTSLGATVFFTPCSTTTPGCVGPVTLTLAVSSAPRLPVATVDIDIVAQDGVGSAAPCLVGGNILFLDGHDDIFNRRETIRNADWSATNSNTTVTVDVNPVDSTQGFGYFLAFSSEEFGQPLGLDIYDHAERWPFESPGHPGWT